MIFFDGGGQMPLCSLCGNQDGACPGGMEVSLERLAADRFLQQAAVPPGRRRFGLIRQQSKAPAR